MTEPEQTDLDPVDSFSERRKVAESLKDQRGINIYGSERCYCETCGLWHWKRATSEEAEETT